MENSLLGTLPAEMRNTIWSLVLCDPEPVRVELPKSLFSPERHKYRYLPGLLASCKQARDEGRQMFLASNTFQLETPSRPASVCTPPNLDEGVRLRAFLHHLDRAGLPPPASLVIRIRRSYSGVSVRDSPLPYGREMPQQLREVIVLTAHAGIPNVVCRLETSFGFSAVRTADISMGDFRRSARSEIERLEQESKSDHFPRTPCGMAMLYMWTTLSHTENMPGVQIPPRAPAKSG